jgi:DsbC/DsbD-like thiol-disulfide interchange protein
MNDIRELDGGDGTGSGEGYPAGARSGRAKRCCQPSSRKKRDEMIVLSSAVVCCFLPMFVVAGGSGGKKGADAKVPVVAVAGGGGEGAATGAGGSGAAAEAREKMEVDGSKMVKMTLLFSDSADIGEENRVGTFAVVFEVEKGWHTYWRNAGDSGMPPTFEFTVEPKGMLEIGPPCWPVPQRHIGEGDILDYIHEGRVEHLFEVKRGASWKPDIDIKVVCKASWLVCKEACLPGDGQSEIVIRSSDPQTKEVDEAGDLISWFGYPCDPLESHREVQQVQMTWNGTALEISPTHDNVGRMTFFPFAEEGDATPLNILADGEVKGDGERRPMLILRFAEDDVKQGKHVRGVLQIQPLRDNLQPGYQLVAGSQTIDIPTPRPPE